MSTNVLDNPRTCGSDIDITVKRFHIRFTNAECLALTIVSENLIGNEESASQVCDQEIPLLMKNLHR